MVIWALIDVLWLSLIFDGYTTIIPIPLQRLKLNTMDPNSSFEHGTSSKSTGLVDHEAFRIGGYPILRQTQIY